LPLLGRRLQRQRQPRLASAANRSKSLQGAQRWPRGPEILKAAVIRASNCSVMVWGRWNCAGVISYPSHAHHLAADGPAVWFRPQIAPVLECCPQN
jgi:hypothetical protein